MNERTATHITPTDRVASQHSCCQSSRLYSCQFAVLLTFEVTKAKGRKAALQERDHSLSFSPSSVLSCCGELMNTAP
jgi:hypothetical protein